MTAKSKDGSNPLGPNASAAIRRLNLIVSQVGYPLKQQLVAAVDEGRASNIVRTKSFARGVLAHLLLVPCWVVPPFVFLASLISVGAPLGLKGTAGAMTLGAAIMQKPKMRPLLCAMLFGLAGVSRKSRAMYSSLLAALFAWVASRANPIPNQPWLFNFVSTWIRDYYSDSCLRGDLASIKFGKTFFGFHPHGCLSAGFSLNGCWNPDFLRLAGKMSWLIDRNLRHVNPGFRLMAEAYETDERSIESCDSSDFKRLMSKGVSVAFIPGGFLDAVAFEYGKDVCVLRKKKGFIKYCLQYGYRLHPVYTFGECETYHTFTGFRSWRMKVAEQNVPAVAFFGWPLLPFLPRTQSKILTYVGTGIDLPLIADPSAAEIDHWHQVYMDALRKLFNEYKAEAGYPNSTLEIL